MPQHVGAFISFQSGVRVSNARSAVSRRVARRSRNRRAGFVHADQDPCGRFVRGAVPDLPILPKIAIPRVKIAQPPSHFPLPSSLPTRRVPILVEKTYAIFTVSRSLVPRKDTAIDGGRRNDGSFAERMGKHIAGCSMRMARPKRSSTGEKWISPRFGSSFRGRDRNPPHFT